MFSSRNPSPSSSFARPSGAAQPAAGVPKVELHASVKAFCSHECLLFGKAIAPFRGQAPALDAWLDELGRRVANPFHRMFALLNIDLPRLRGDIQGVENAINGTELAALIERSSSADASLLDQMAPALHRNTLRELDIKKSRLQEGSKFVSAGDPFWAHVARGAISLEAPPDRRAHRIKPGDLVQHEYNRNRILGAALPPQELSQEQVASFLGGDLAWLLRCIADEQRAKAEIARTIQTTEDAEVRKMFLSSTITVHFPAPLGPEQMTYSKFAALVQSEVATAAQTAMLAEAVDRYFMARAGEVLKVRSRR